MDGEEMKEGEARPYEVDGGWLWLGIPPVVASGQWSVVSGQWSVASGQWSVVSGQLLAASGQWPMVSGQ